MTFDTRNSKNDFLTSGRRTFAVESTMTFLATEPPSALIASPDSNKSTADDIALNEPKWIYEKREEWGEHFSLPEWQDHAESEHEGHRTKNGWKVRDKMYNGVQSVR